MDEMNRLGGHEYSEVRDGFRWVIQSDMQIEPADCGAPVVDLDGKVVGVAVARAGRIKTLIIPAAALADLLETRPERPRLEDLAARAQPVPEGGGRRQGEGDPFEDMRRNMEDMRRLMERLEDRGDPRR